MNDKVHLIVWSKDRAAQLECLLNSIKTYLPGVFVISVLHKNSGQEFKITYDQLLEQEDSLFDSDCSTFIEEKDFYTDTMRLVKDQGSEFVCFCTDDTVFFSKPETNITKDFLDSIFVDNVCTFAMRLGLNTILQDCFNGTLQPPLTNYIINENYSDVISWNFRDYHPLLNYGYPCGLDGHIFRREVLENIIDFKFRSTNELESGMFHRQDKLPPIMTSYNKSISVNIPKNNVTGVTKSEGVPLSQMNAKFLAGKRLRLKDNQNIIGSHQLLNLEWV